MLKMNKEEHEFTSNAYSFELGEFTPGAEWWHSFLVICKGPEYAWECAGHRQLENKTSYL